MAHPYHPIRTGPAPGPRGATVHRRGDAARPLCARARRAARAARGLPRPRLPGLVLLRRRRPEPGGRAGFDVDAVWIFAEVGGTIPANPVLPDPLERPLDAPGVARPGPVHLAPGPDGDRLRAAVRPPRRAGRPAHVGARARRRGEPAGGRGGRASSWRSPLPSAVFMAQPDNFGLYQPLVAGALWMGARGLRGHARSFALGGLLVGLATLARNDGVLVGAALALAFAWDRWRAWRSGGAAPAGDPALGRGRLLRRSSWRSWRRGSPASWPSSGRSRPRRRPARCSSSAPSSEWNSITTPASLEWLLGQGVGPLVASRIGGLVAALDDLRRAGRRRPPGAVHGRSAAGPAAARPDFGPFFAYAGLLFAFSTLVSAVHVPGGTFIHSAVALAPHAYVLALEGIAVAVGWVAARRRTWNAAARHAVLQPRRDRPRRAPGDRERPGHPGRLGRPAGRLPAGGRRPGRCRRRRRTTA